MNFKDLPRFVLVELICRISCCGLISQCKCVSTCWCIFILLIAFDVNQGIISIANYTCLNKHFQRNYFPMREISLTMLLTLMFRQFMSSNGLRDEPTTVCTYNDLVLCRLGLGYYWPKCYICNLEKIKWAVLPLPSPQGFYEHNAQVWFNYLWIFLPWLWERPK